MLSCQDLELTNGKSGLMTVGVQKGVGENVKRRGRGSTLGSSQSRRNVKVSEDIIAQWMIEWLALAIRKGVFGLSNWLRHIHRMVQTLLFDRRLK